MSGSFPDRLPLPLLFYLIRASLNSSTFSLYVSVSDSELRQAVASEQSGATALYTAQPGTPLAYVTTQPEFGSVAAATQLVAGAAVHSHHTSTQHHMDPYPLSAPTPHHHLQTTYCRRRVPRTPPTIVPAPLAVADCAPAHLAQWSTEWSSCCG